ncbi:MAG: 3-deoxy-D-manno-octulosonic-acid kinase [Planctomycetes bacterium ADurb.Bin412]|nr:MAG: 3-deoxy-D-manno-octulosonic-acid kinase [Planctomycetes bacterium ADurb.Bin412]
MTGGDTGDYIRRFCLGYQIRILRKYNQELLVKLVCEGPGRREGLFTPVNSSENSRVFYFEWQGKGFYLKQYLRRNWLEYLKEIFRGSRSERTRKNHAMLAQYGFAAPCIVMTGWNGDIDFAVSESIASFLNLRRYVEKLGRELPAAEFCHRKKQLTRDLGHTVGSLHQKRISHGDLRWGNIHVDDTEEDRFRFWFIDNERTIRHVFPAQRIRVKNLVQLNIIPHHLASGRDCYRFFHAYLEENPGDLSHKHQLSQKIIQKTRLRLQQKQKGTSR